MPYFLEYWSDHSEIWNTCWIWSLDHVYQKAEFFKNSFSFLIKTAYFTQKRNFFIHVYVRVDILISCPSFSRVLHNSTQKHRKIRHFSRCTCIWSIIHDLHFLILTCLHKNHSFSLLLPSEAIANDELSSIAPNLHTNTTFLLLIFNKKLQVVVGYRFFLFFLFFFSFFYLFSI